MGMPDRITLSRVKGWKMPPNTVVVARPSKFGNPFTIGAAESSGYTRQGAVAAFEDWLAGNPWACPTGDTYEVKRQAILTNLHELRGKNLACWCRAGDKCHADVLLRLANA